MGFRHAPFRCKLRPVQAPNGGAREKSHKNARFVPTSALPAPGCQSRPHTTPQEHKRRRQPRCPKASHPASHRESQVHYRAAQDSGIELPSPARPLTTPSSRPATRFLVRRVSAFLTEARGYFIALLRNSVGNKLSQITKLENRKVDLNIISAQNWASQWIF